MKKTEKEMIINKLNDVQETLEKIMNMIDEPKEVKTIYEEFEKKFNIEVIPGKDFIDIDYKMGGGSRINKDKTIAPILHSNQVVTELLFNIAYVLNDGWKPDWNNEDETKYHIYYDTSDSSYSILWKTRWMYFNTIYFKSIETATEALEWLKNLGLIDYLLIEQ